MPYCLIMLSLVPGVSSHCNCAFLNACWCIYLNNASVFKQYSIRCILTGNLLNRGHRHCQIFLVLSSGLNSLRNKVKDRPLILRALFIVLYLLHMNFLALLRERKTICQLITFHDLMQDVNLSSSIHPRLPPQVLLDPWNICCLCDDSFYH